MACAHLEEALRLVTGQRERAEISLEVAETYAALFRVDAVDVLERALAELGEAGLGHAARLEGELVVCGLPAMALVAAGVVIFWGGAPVALAQRRGDDTR